MTPAKVDAALAKLREPFPAEIVGKLPRVTCKACSERTCRDERHKPRKCEGCNAYTSPAHIHIDFVGHAHVTDRLLSVDPDWTWEPVAFGPDGLPAIGTSTNGRDAVMWIRLTIAGVTRLGVGSVAKGSFEAEKQLIGDAIRNAAMRFGVALDLWAKADLESTLSHETAEAPSSSAPPARQEQPSSPAPAARPARPAKPAAPKRVGSAWVKDFIAKADAIGASGDERREIAALVSEGRTQSLSAIFETEAAAALAHLEHLAAELADQRKAS